jgi:thiol-disulfide isomerase/thioredoxin
MQYENALVLCAALFATAWCQALTIAPYSPEVFAKLQAADGPVALHFRADWCPTCRAQDKSLSALKADQTLKLTVLTVDYDKETELKRELRVQSQSTFIVYLGKAEKTRQIGETSADSIRRALSTSLQ